ncbi:MAG: 50S ribosomal protein L31 [Chloroflexi bacterium]|nr:50S ribosomal protein L31 [Chloroflexota bacterium]
MKANIHPKWFPEANVICACGNTWKTGATVPEIRTDICSACHPFYTGEQRIVDTEGQVDRFLKRLQIRDTKRADAEARKVSKTPLDLPIAELGLAKRYTQLFADNGINVVSDFLSKLEAGGEQTLIDAGLGRKIIMDTKKVLRARGYEVPTAEAAEAE